MILFKDSIYYTTQSGDRKGFIRAGFDDTYNAFVITNLSYNRAMEKTNGNPIFVTNRDIYYKDKEHGMIRLETTGGR